MPTSDRTVDELLQLTTYQGMTDTEIESIIHYKMQCAYDSALSSAAIAQTTQTLDNLILQDQANHNALTDMIEYIMSYMPPMQTIEVDENIDFGFTEVNYGQA